MKKTKKVEMIGCTVLSIDYVVVDFEDGAIKSTTMFVSYLHINGKPFPIQDGLKQFLN